MHGGVHPREVGAPHGPRVARGGVRKKQLLDHDIIRPAHIRTENPRPGSPRILLARVRGIWCGSDLRFSGAGVYAMGDPV